MPTFKEAIKNRPKETEYIFASRLIGPLDMYDVRARAMYLTRKTLIKTTIFPDRWDCDSTFISEGILDRLIWKKKGLPDIQNVEIDNSGKVKRMW